MATANVARAAHATLSSTTVDIVNLSDTVHLVEVLNRSGTANLSVTWASGGATAATPVQLAAETICIPEGKSTVFAVSPDFSNPGLRPYATQVKVLGDGNAYSVQGLQ